MVSGWSACMSLTFCAPEQGYNAVLFYSWLNNDVRLASLPPSGCVHVPRWQLGRLTSRQSQSLSNWLSCDFVLATISYVIRPTRRWYWGHDAVEDAL